MDKFVIYGGRKLNGITDISGAKNASLALMPASLLASGNTTLLNTPELNDVYTMIKLLKHLGTEIIFEGHTLKLNTSNIKNFEAPYEHVRKMRASIYVLAPLLARYGYAKVSMPGGCAWGPRPINLHINGLLKLGADVKIERGYIIAKADKLKGAKIELDVPSVGATGNILMAASLAKGTTLISNAAKEPEITNLAEMLLKMGGKIGGIGTSELEIEGVDELKASEIKTIPDRIEAGTFLIAAAITKGKIIIKNSEPKHFSSVLNQLEESGAELVIKKDEVELNAESFDKERIKSVNVETGVYPGFPTDMQAQWISYMSLANGVSKITDTIYIDRFTHVSELNRLGADITVKGNSAIIKGVKELKGAKVMSTDLRASASLVLAGLAAEGITEVLRVYHLDRGYQKIEKKLSSLGAKIERVKGDEY